MPGQGFTSSIQGSGGRQPRKGSSYKYAVCAALVAAMLTAGAVIAAEGAKGVNVHKYTMKSIDGQDVDLSKYDGKVLLIVNVASKCGLTPQYKDLQALHDKYSDKGLAILGFPANNFMGQEPGTNSEIKAFCTENYGVKFDMFSKISVKGDDIHPMYAELTSKEKNGEYGGDIQWNFDKFLADKDGNIIARFSPRTVPSDESITSAIEANLAK